MKTMKKLLAVIFILALTVSTAVSALAATVQTEAGKTVTVTFSSTLELADGVTYTVNIPVRPSADAQKAANESGAQQSVFPSNQGAVLTYQYGDSTADAAYAEAPTITVLKENTFTLSYDANGGTGAPDAETKTVKASSCAFTVSAAEPEKEGCTFGGWL